MFKFLGLLLALAGLVNCTTKEVSTDIGKLKKRERLYVGTLNLEFNDQINKKANCDIFLSDSFNADFKLSEDGFIVFTSSAKKTSISKIACPYQNGKDKIWVYYRLDLEPLQKSSSNKEITYFGNINVKWSINEKDISKWASNLARVDSKVENVGTFNISISSDFSNFSDIAKKKIKHLNEADYKLTENTFKRDQDILEKEADQKEEDEE